jgi:hypothetical protein
MRVGEPVDIQELVHVGPGTLGGRYWRRFWQPIYRVADLPAGTAKPLTILGESFTLYRGESGAYHLIAFRCAHRGTQLSVGWVEERLGRVDQRVIINRKLWTRELTALRDDQPLKTWLIPEAPLRPPPTTRFV